MKQMRSSLGDKALIIKVASRYISSSSFPNNPTPNSSVASIILQLSSSSLKFSDRRYYDVIRIIGIKCITIVPKRILEV